MGFEQERCKGGCHDLSAYGVDVPGSVPNLAHRHVSCQDLWIELGTWN